MVVLARLSWIRSQLLLGANVGVHVAYNPSTGKDKVRFTLQPCGSSSALSSGSFVAEILDLIERVASRSVVVDRGHRFSNGTAEASFWFERLPTSYLDGLDAATPRLRQEALPFVPSAKLHLGSSPTSVAAEDSPGLASLQTQLVHFASSITSHLTSMHAGLLSLVASHDAATDRPSPGTSVSLDFVNELLDTLFVPDAPVRFASKNAAAAAVGPDAQPVVTTTSVVTGDACTHNVAVTGNNNVVDFVVGDTVWLRDLISKPELNGKEGRILSGPTSTGRYAVHIPPSALFGRAEQNVTVKPQNFTKHLFGGT
jgi:hypothetical protein